MNISSIYEGWKNRLIEPEQWVKDLSEARLKICSGCKHKITGIVFDECGACGCELKAKSLSTQESCPEGFWPTVNKTEK